MNLNNEIITDKVVETLENIYIDDENMDMGEIIDELDEIIERVIGYFNDRFKIINIEYELNR